MGQSIKRDSLKGKGGGGGGKQERMARTHAEAQPLLRWRISPFCFFSLVLSILSLFSSCLSFLTLFSPLKSTLSFVILYNIFGEVPAKSITQMHGVVTVIVYKAREHYFVMSVWVNVNSENLFSFTPHMRILRQISTAQAHCVIKFRLIRLISILIKTLTPPYAIRGPRHLFSPHEGRDG